MKICKKKAILGVFLLFNFFFFQVFALSKEQMQSLSAGYGGQRRRDLSLADWPALFEKYLAPWLVKETGKLIFD